MWLHGRIIAPGLVLQALATQAWHISDRTRINYVGGDGPEPLIIPRYNITMPLDHFNASDARTFNNRYFVNDTYYKPGGPVIFHDFGESGVDDWYAAAVLGGWNGTQSAALELAKARNGVLVGWEHRYYGYSHPFPVTRDGYPPSTTGLPAGGAADYKYLTVAQALEDVTYFADRFNQTRLGGRNVVLAGENATRHLGPWQAPWIWVGGSYSGMRGAWMRLHNPYVIYAVWASSAPVATVPDAWAYTNSIYRALPGNCTADMRAAVSRIDGILDGGNTTEMTRLARLIELAEYNTSSVKARSGSDASKYGIDYFRPVLAGIFKSLIDRAQDYGYTGHLQKFCDIMEGFDVPSFLSNSSTHSNDDTVFLWNKGNAVPPKKGIAASAGEFGPEAALAAYLYAVNRHFEGDLVVDEKRSISESHSFYEAITPWQDVHSWEWQVLSELGLVISVNDSLPIFIGSKYLDYDYMRKEIVTRYFGSFAPGDIPAAPDTDYPMVFGGWRIAVSNTMFTNGEFDPWRAYGVASLEWELDNFPRYITQDVPQCGTADYFGMRYGLIVSCPFLEHPQPRYSLSGTELTGTGGAGKSVPRRRPHGRYNFVARC